MEALVALADQARQSLAVSFLLHLVPVAVTVAALASWRNRVPNAGLIALGGGAYCLWLLAPLHPALPELRQVSQYLSILGWLWLVMAWVRHVLTEWPAPIWGHWLAGTLLLALPLTGLATLLLA